MILGVLPRLASLAVLAALCVLAAGCGSSESGGGGLTTTDAGPRAAPPTKPEDVIRAWADAQRANHIDAATRLFAVPSIVFNGGPPMSLRTRAQVRAFNSSLPCGARLLRTMRHASFVIATFRLTKRPGARCDGPGGTARTAFKIRKGKIAQWLRVPESGSVPRANPLTPAPAPEQRVPAPRAPEV